MNLVKENIIGIIGLIALCAGIPLPIGLLKFSLNIIGFIALIIYAYKGKNALFFYFEIVALIGYILSFMPIANHIKYLLMVILTLAAFAKIFSFEKFRRWYTGFGIAGLVGLIYGYLANSNLGYAIGGIGMVIYSFIGFFQGTKIALIFGILNIIYGSIAIYMLFNY